MPLNLLYGCCQIETSTADLAQTRTFMVNVLGGGPIEQALAREIAQIIPDAGYDVDHLDCGQAVFQINQPSPTMVYNGGRSIHQAYLDRVGPCVTNLNFFVDDHAHARELLSELGAANHIEGPSSAARALADYGPDNTREGADERPFLFMGTRDLIGLDLEIMEPNFLRFSRQAVQYPAFVQPRPRTGDGNLRLERLILAVGDLEQVHHNLVRLFTPASRSRPYAVRSGPGGKAFRITLGGIELEYREPLSDRGPLGEALARFGPGVVAVEFSASDQAGVLSRCRERAVEVEHDFDPIDEVRAAARHRIGCRSLTGFDVVLADRSRPLAFTRTGTEAMRKEDPPLTTSLDLQDAIEARHAEILEQPPRLPPVDRETVAAEVQATTDWLRRGVSGTTGELPAMPLGAIPEIMFTLCRYPELWRAIMEVTVQIQGPNSALEPRDRKLAILRVGWLCQAPYEFGEHVAQARRMGFTSEEIEAIIAGSAAPNWNDHERAILRAAEELHKNAMVSDQTWRLLSQHMNDQQLFELLIVVGQFTATAYFQNSLRLRLEANNKGLAAR